MKYVLSLSLLAGLMGMVGCAHYHSGGTSPYYTSYYNTYDSVRRCYYHCCDRPVSRVYSGNSFNSASSHHNSGGGHHHGGGHEHHHHDGGHDHHK